jgi:lysophospholipase L1-like esterase
MNEKRRARVGALVAVVALLAAGCGSGQPAQSVTSIKYYVSLGDSYAVGDQPVPSPHATSGFTAYVATAEHLRLKNFGCGGATSESILSVNGCAGRYGPVAATDAVAYPASPQATAAESFIRAHKGSIGLVTVSIGGNDVTSCATASNPITCFFTAVSTAQVNITKLAKALRSAAGPGVPIIGLTYPDVLLGIWVHAPKSIEQSGAGQSVAKLSVTGFQDYLNPALDMAYSRAGAKFVDITAATGAYTPLTEMTTVSPYGQIPVAVAQICKLTWYCALGSIHGNTEGYAFIGQQIVSAYGKLLRS